MMLQALVQYAERENLGGDPDFEPADVDWLIPLTKAGQLAGPPIDLRESPKRKEIPTLEQKLLTDANRPRARFLCDALERSLGWFDEKKPQRAGRAAGSLSFFTNLLRDCRASSRADVGCLDAVLRFLGDAAAVANVRAQLAAAKAKPNELATFSVDGVWLLDLEEPAQFWRSWRKQLKPSSAANKRLCFATGELAETVDTTGVIKGVPGGNPSGTIFLSFDKDAFCSFGLEQAQNAGLSAEAELKVRSALTRLIERSRSQKLVFNNTICLHWTRKRVDFDPVDTLASANPEEVAQLIKSVETGRQVTGLDANAYYAVSLSGNGARIVVRDWIESTVPEIREHIGEWFRDLGMVEPGGVNVKHEFSLGQLLYFGLANPGLEKPFEALPHGAAEELLRSALTGGPVPQNILMSALRRETVDRVSGGNEAGQRNPFLPARFALIKLCLLRSPTRKEHHTMSEKLDPNSKDRAYLCGQLFAVLGRLQLLALGPVGASIAERTYGGVATRPATTLGPLFTKVPAYLKKANDRFPGSGTNKQKEIEALCQRIEAQDGLPQTLGLEEQGRFALGYYCQLAEYRARAEEREIEEKAEQITDENK
jgi:CRISPR-associated protein Csd1